MSTAIDQQVVTFQEQFKKVKEEVSKVIVGYEESIDGGIMSMLAGGHVLLEGVPGLGKTKLVSTLSDVMRLKFSRIQFTPDLTPADITGTNVVQEDAMGEKFLEFQPGPIFSNIVLADEVNRATPKTQSALLEAMEERSVTVGKRTHKLDSPFFVLATQNPLEMEGTYPLPEAQLDRFLLKVLVRFPNAKDLMQIIDTTVGLQTLQAKQVASGEQLIHLIKTARAVPVATHVKEYAVRLLLATHPDQEDAPDPVRKYVRYGASPRGLQALIMTSKVLALLEGRYNVSLEDLQHVAFPSLRHRIILNFDGLADGVIAEDLIETIVEETSTP